MSTYKRFLFIPMFLVFSCLLCGCVIIPREDRFYVYDPKDVSSVEIYYFEDGYDSSCDGDMINETEPFYVLEESQHEDFLSDLGAIEYRDYIIIVLAAIDPSFSYDNWTAKIIFNDGSYRLLSCHGYGEEFDAEGNKTDWDHYGCDDDEWYSLIKKYVPEDLVKATETTVAESTMIE